MTPNEAPETDESRESRSQFDLSDLADCFDLLEWTLKLCRGLVRTVVDMAGGLLDAVGPLLELLASLGEGLLSALDFLSFF